MAQDETIDRVGLGVDLLGGPEVLSDLRAIRQEYEAIIELGTRAGQTAGPGSDLNKPRTSRSKAIEDEEIASQRRRAKAASDATREITDADVKMYADAAQRRIELKARGDAELLRREKEFQQEQTRIVEQAERDRQQRILRERNSFANPRSPVLARQINQLPIEDLGTSTRSGVGVVRRAGPSPYGASSPITQRVIDDGAISIEEMAAIKADREIKNAARRARSGQGPISQSGATGDISQAELRAMLASGNVGANKGAFTLAGPGGGSPPPKIPTGPNAPFTPTGGNPFDQSSGALNQRGFFTTSDAVGRITRNLLLYQGISLATRGLADYVIEAAEAAKKSTDLGHAMDFATQQSGGSIEANRKLRDSLLAIGETRQQAQNAVIQSARFTIDRPQDTKALVDVITNVSASRGLGIDKVGDTIQQLRDRKPRVFEELFDTKPEDLYKKFAANQLDTQTGQDFRGIGDTRGTRTSQIAKIVSALTDQQKHEIELNFILSQSSKYTGEAADRANTLAGRIDRVSASFANGKEIVGLFITEIKPIGDLLDAIIGKAGILEKFRPAELGRTGPQGTISSSDITKYGVDTTTGPRANALREVNTLGTPLVEGAIAVAGLALFGRNQAKANLQLNTYNKILSDYTTNVGTVTNAAEKSARDAVTNLKPGLVRSVDAGLGRITIGLTESIKSTYENVTSALTTNRPSIVSRTNDRLGAQGPYSLYNPDQIVNRYNSVQRGGQIAGGLAGGIIGATLGSIVAEKLNVGPIVATGLTIAGGIAGSAIGTSIGTAIGGAFLGYVKGAGGFAALAEGGAAAAGTSLAFLGGATGVGLAAAAVTQVVTSPYLEQNALKRREAEGIAYAQQAKEQQKLLDEDRVRYRSAIAGDTTGLLTPKQVADRGNAIGDGNGGFLNYVKEIIPPLTEAQKLAKDFNAEIEKIQNSDRPDVIKQQDIRDLKEQQHNAEIEKLDPGYKARQEDALVKRLDKDRADAAKAKQARDQQIADQSAALSKLRFAKDASFEVVGRNAELIAGSDNPYVKALSDQVTIAERMKQQWGFLGQGVVDYQTKLETAANSKALIKLDFASYAQSSGLRGQVLRESDQREGPGLSRKDQEYLDIQNAIVDRARQIPELWKQAADVLGQTNLTPQQQFSGRINLISQAFGVQGPRLRNVYGQDITPDNTRRNAYGQYLGDNFAIEPRKNIYGQNLEDPAIAGAFSLVGAGQSKEVQRAIQKNYADTLLDAFKGLSPQQIRASGYGDVYLGALRQQGNSLQDNISQAREKAQFGAIEDDRLAKQLRADDEFRRKQLAAGGDAGDIGRASDQLLISRTDGINPKDLSFQQFKDRAEALRRQADRTEADRAEAAAAVKTAQASRDEMNIAIGVIRDAIINGDLKMLIQVQNDTQARVDSEALQNANPGANPKDTKAKQSNYTNPAKSSKRRYGSVNDIPIAQ